MGFFDSFKIKTPNSVDASTANTGLQILFAAPFNLKEADFTRQLRAYDGSLSTAQVSVLNAGEGSSLTDVSWGEHSVQIVTFGLPMPAQVTEACIAPAHYDAPTKALARDHKAHGLLFYKGQSQNVSEQYIALALTAGALCGEGGIVVMNEVARTSMPARVFTGEMGQSRLELLRSLPPLYLFAGFVKYELEGKSGVWMRTHGLELWGLLNLATHVQSHAQGSEIFEIFSNVVDYMIARGPILCAGHTMQIGDDTYMKLREPTLSESAMGNVNEVLIANFIRSDESNPFVFNA